jgi:hypothetical protein
VDISHNVYKSFALADSRVFSHPSQGYQLHPIIDLINHSDQSNIKWYMPDDARARVVATRDIMKGEEILANYGLKPSWDWGADYGFCPDQSGLQDFVAIPLFPLSLNITEDVESEILERLIDTMHNSIVLSLTGRKSQSFHEKVMRPCIIWRSSAVLSDLIPIYKPIARVLDVMERENRIISREEMLHKQDDCNVDKVYQLVVDCLSSRLEYLHESSMIAMEWMQLNNAKIRKGRVYLADRLRDAEWNACMRMKVNLETMVHMAKEVS